MTPKDVIGFKVFNPAKGLTDPQRAPLPEDTHDQFPNDQFPNDDEIVAAVAAADEEDDEVGVPAEDVAKWVESWGSTNELPVPTPRKLTP